MGRDDSRRRIGLGQTGKSPLSAAGRVIYLSWGATPRKVCATVVTTLVLVEVPACALFSMGDVATRRYFSPDLPTSASEAPKRNDLELRLGSAPTTPSRSGCRFEFEFARYLRGSVGKS